MQNYIVVWKPPQDGDYDAPIVMAIAHSKDMNDAEIDPKQGVSVWRLRYRKPEKTLRMIKDDDVASVRALQNAGQLSSVVPVTRDMQADAVIKELTGRIQSGDLLGKSARKAAGHQLTRTPSALQNTTVGGYVDAQSESGSGSDGEGSEMSSVDDPHEIMEFWKRMERAGSNGVGVTNAEAGFKCAGDGNLSPQSSVSFTSTEFM
eukprot:3938852-Rhodomonas_salina.1